MVFVFTIKISTMFVNYKQQIKDFSFLQQTILLSFTLKDTIPIKTFFTPFVKDGQRDLLLSWNKCQMGKWSSGEVE